MPSPDTIATFALHGLTLLWGAAWGSFLNVVIYRLPAGRSVVRPGSACPSCGHQIRWYENIPVLSWAALGGRCSACKTPISMRYPAVEAVTAALALATASPWISGLLSGGLPPEVAIGGALAEHVFVFTLVAIALIDADTFLIPDVLSLPLPVLGVGAAVLIGEVRGVDWLEAAAGAGVGGLGLLAVQWGYTLATGREGLGTGDVKLLAGLGAWCGLASLPSLLLLSAVQGLAFAGLMLWTEPNAQAERGGARLAHIAVPYGPFLVIAALQWTLLHQRVAPWLAPWLDG
jgi:leader peptidase (prepilin peptidase)/N-methyltransferase